jgi:hypothetical protein
MKKNRTFTVKALLMTMTIIFLLTGCFGTDEITGTSEKNYFEMQSEIGCGSANGEDKREDTFDKDYKNKWMTFKGQVSTIDGEKLTISCDENIIPDLNIKFNDKKSIYDLKIGSFIEVKFVMRELGGCFESYEADNGEILKKDIDKMVYTMELMKSMGFLKKR